jgi:hypothetical protein
MSNLVSNALKYASEGEIKISGVRPDEVIIVSATKVPGSKPGPAAIFLTASIARRMSNRQKAQGSFVSCPPSSKPTAPHGADLEPDSGAGSASCPDNTTLE